MITLKGIPASPGICIGKAFLFDSQKVSVIKKKISKESIPKEISRFEEALILAMRGEYAAAMDLNSRLCSDILGVPNDVADAAKASGAYAAGITGTGPATVVLCSGDRLQAVTKGIQRFEGEILRAKLNHTCSREVVPRLL